LKRVIKIISLVLAVLLLLEASALNTCAVMRPMIRENNGILAAQAAAQQQENLPLPEPTEAEPVEQPEEGEAVPQETEALPVETSPEEPVEEKPVRKTQVPENFYEVPEYYQTDYPDTLFGNGTVASSGCSITALAMVATYLTEHVYMPDELAGYFGGYIGNNMQRLEYASDQLQLPWRKAKNWHDALAALEEGKVVIALMGETSAFTNSQHYIVLAGMTVDGKILVNDPYTPNYDNWKLAPGFEEGFSESAVCWGFSGGWIYDKGAMPEDPFIYEAEEKETVECRYPEIQLTDEEKTMFAKLLWLECRGESHEGQQAVAEVILNRLAADNFPETLKGIIYAKGQFPCTEHMDEATPTQTQYEAIEAALYGPYILPEDVVFYAKFKVNENYWGKIGEHYFCYQYNWKPEGEAAASEPAAETQPEPTAETLPEAALETAPETTAETQP